MFYPSPITTLFGSGKLPVYGAEEEVDRSFKKNFKQKCDELRTERKPQKEERIGISLT